MPTAAERLCGTAGWAAAGAGAGGAAWVLALVAAEWVFGRPVHAADLSGAGIMPGFLPPLVGGGWGVVVGLVAGALRGGPGRVPAALVWAALTGTAGVLAGLMTPLLVTAGGGRFSPAVCSSPGWAAGGALHGAIVYIWRRPEPDHPGPAEPRAKAKSVLGGLGWSFSAGAVPFLVCVCGLTAGERLLGGPPDFEAFGGSLGRSAAVLALIDGWWGLFVGVAAGYLCGGDRGRDHALAWGPILAVAGVLGGGLAPVLADATPAWLPPAVSSSLGWALAGASVGAVGYLRGRSPVQVVASGEETAAGTRRAPAPPWPRPPGPRVPDYLLPVVGVILACLIAVAVRPPSDAGWAVLAVALLGSAVGGAMLGQHRRVRALERRVRRLERRRRSGGG